MNEKNPRNKALERQKVQLRLLSSGFGFELAKPHDGRAAQTPAAAAGSCAHCPWQAHRRGLL